MALDREDLQTINEILIERVEKTTQRGIDEIRGIVADSMTAQNKRIDEHENRLVSLEGVKHKALFVWTFIVAAATSVVTVLVSKFTGWFQSK